jgi:hypothetical protein
LSESVDLAQIPDEPQAEGPPPIPFLPGNAHALSRAQSPSEVQEPDMVDAKLAQVSVELGQRQDATRSMVKETTAPNATHHSQEHSLPTVRSLKTIEAAKSANPIELVQSVSENEFTGQRRHFRANSFSLQRESQASTHESATSTPPRQTVVDQADYGSNIVEPERARSRQDYSAQVGHEDIVLPSQQGVYTGELTTGVPNITELPNRQASHMHSGIQLRDPSGTAHIETIQQLPGISAPPADRHIYRQRFKRLRSRAKNLFCAP